MGRERPPPRPRRRLDPVAGEAGGPSPAGRGTSAVRVDRAVHRRTARRVAPEATRSTTAALATPATVDQGAASVTLAKGRDAANRTTETRAARTSQPGRPSSVAASGGTPIPASQPPTRASVPAAMAGGTSGTTTRLTSGARIARRPNPARTTGSVAASAANEMPRLSASQPGSRPPRQPTEPVRDRGGPGDEARRREHGQLEARIGDRGRIRQQEQDDGPAERDDGRARAARLAGDQGDRGHDGRPNDGRRGACGDRVGDDRDQGGDGPAAAAESTSEERGHHRRHDRDVPARDRDDVAHPGGRERGREVAVDPVAEADEDPGGEAGLGLGQRPGQGVARGPPQALDRARRGPVAAESLERPCPQRRGDADPAQVRAVAAVVGRESLEAPADDDAIVRRDLGIAGQRGGDAKAGRVAGSVPRRARASRSAARRAASRRSRRRRPTVRRRRGSPRAEPVSRRGPAGRAIAARADGQALRAGAAPTAPAHGGPERLPRRARAGSERGGRRAPSRSPERRPAQGGDDRSNREPAAPRDGGPTRGRHRTTTRSRSFSNVDGPTSFRVRRSSTEANGRSSRAAMILAAVTGPMPGRESSSAAVARLRSTGPAADPPAAAACPRQSRRPPVRPEAGSGRRARGRRSGRRRSRAPRGSAGPTPGPRRPAAHSRPPR